MESRAPHDAKRSALAPEPEKATGNDNSQAN
jgi:hypothetical protein